MLLINFLLGTAAVFVPLFAYRAFLYITDPKKKIDTKLSPTGAESVLIQA